jgi:hypothetical protein
MKVTFYEVVQRTVKYIPKYKSKQSNKIKLHTTLACPLYFVENCNKAVKSG